MESNKLPKCYGEFIDHAIDCPNLYLGGPEPCNDDCEICKFKDIKCNTCKFLIECREEPCQ